jgi:hypothetical protein
LTIKAYTKDSLSADRRERLEGVAGWEWDPYAEDWDEGFAQLTAYVQASRSRAGADALSDRRGLSVGEVDQ